MRSIPGTQLFVETRKGIERMRVSSVCRLAIKAGWLLAALASCAVFVYAQRPPGPRGDEETFRFRFVGPHAGNRVASIAGVPGDPSTYYAGAASGGVWKTTDGGNRWEPIFDKEPAAAIGAIAVAPSDPSVIWVGTGEAWAIRDSDVMGNGVYVSTDSGKSWTWAGLEDTGRIGRIVVHPRNPDVAFVCALGRNRSAACIALPIGDNTGSAYFLPTPIPVARDLPWIRTIRGFFLRACGRWKCTLTER